MTFEEAKRAAIARAQTHAGRVHVLEIDGDYHVMIRDEIERVGIAMANSPSPVVGYTEREEWHTIRELNPRMEQ